MAGAIGAGVGLVYLVGGASLALRYEGLGLPGHLSAANTPREVLLAAGLRTLAIWTVLGVASVLVLKAIPTAAVLRVAGSLHTWWGIGAIALLMIVLMVVLRVWWPLAALFALIVIIFASVYWESRPVRQFLVTSLAVGLVAVAYEADRLSYRVEWTCIRHSNSSETSKEAASATGPAHRDQTVCGTLIGQQDRGFYLGVNNSGEPTDASPPGENRLLFIPAARVEDAYSGAQLAEVLASRAEARRETLWSRLWNIDVR